MRVDSYSFGVMKVDGSKYETDLIIFPDRVKPNWWRKEGHRLALEDLDEVLQFGPEVLVVGRGASGLMEVPVSVEASLKEKGIEVIAKPTAQARELFNRQIEKGKKVVGVFHLTC